MELLFDGIIFIFGRIRRFGRRRCRCRRRWSTLALIWCVVNVLGVLRSHERVYIQSISMLNCCIWCAARVISWVRVHFAWSSHWRLGKQNNHWKLIAQSLLQFFVSLSLEMAINSWPPSMDVNESVTVVSVGIGTFIIAPALVSPCPPSNLRCINASFGGHKLVI